MKGAPRVLGAQEFTRQLKNRVLAKSAPPAADQKSNTVATSILGNRTNKVVKLVSDPTKSCSGGWTDESGCCAYDSTSSLDLVVNYADLVLSEEVAYFCSCAATAGSECPGVDTLPPTPYPVTTLTLTFANGGGYELAQLLQVVSFSQGPIDFTGVTATIDGVPTTIASFPGFLDIVFSPGTLTSSSVVVVNFPSPVPVIDAVCIGSSP